MPTPIVLDSGPLILLSDKNSLVESRAWLSAMTREEVVGVVPAAVATEFIRGAPDPRRAVWWLSRFHGIDTRHADGRLAGLLLRRAGDASISVVDAHVVQHAIRLGSPILTTDPKDIRRLVDVSGTKLLVLQLPWPA